MQQQQQQWNFRYYHLDIILSKTLSNDKRIIMQQSRKYTIHYWPNSYINKLILVYTFFKILAFLKINKDKLPILVTIILIGVYILIAINATESNVG
jgi:hypothetical protein